MTQSLGTQCGLGTTAAEDGCRAAEPNTARRYTLAELLAASDHSGPPQPDDRAWVDAPAVGRELI